MRNANISKIPVSRLPPFLQWWCRITSPTKSSQPQWREELASLIIPIDLILLLLAAPTALDNPPILIVLLSLIGAMILSIIVKRMGRFYLAGVLAAFSIEIGLATAIIGAPRLSVAELPLFALLVQPGFVIVAFFSPIMIIVLCVLNCALILYALSFLHIAPDLAASLAANRPAIVVPTLALQIFVSIITLILMTTLIRAIARADRAEEIAELEHRRREQDQRELEMKTQLEEGVQQLIISLNAAASKGDFSVQVPLAQENILWRVGRAVNTLLSRLQGFRRDLAELERTRKVATILVEYTRRGQHFPSEQWTGTSLDPLIIELNRQSLQAKRFPTAPPAPPFHEEK